MATYGPTIEGVVSPTSSKDSIRKALASAATPGTPLDRQAYANVKTVFDAGGSPSAAGTAANMATGAYGALAGAGYVMLPDGNLRSIYSGEVYNPNQVPATQGGTAPTPTNVGGGGGPVGQPVNPPGGGVGEGTNGLETAVNNPGLGEVSKQAIEAQINALQAQYGLDIAQIAALGGEIGAQARFLLDQISIDQGRAQESLIGQLVGRGIFRSGIAARDMGRQAQDFATKRGEVNLNMGSRLRQLAERAGAANVALGRGKADVIGDIDAGNLNAELRQQLLNELNSLTPEDIQRALDQAYYGAPTAVTGLIKSAQGSQVNPDDYLRDFFSSAVPNATRGDIPRR